jgi:phospholipid-transporting ATPase
MQLWFAIYSAWSGLPVFERWTLAMFNVLFTSLPPLAVGLFDRMAQPDTMMRYPALYKLSQDRSAFSIRVFWIWIMQAILHSVILYFLTMALVAHGELARAHTGVCADVVHVNGRTTDWMMLGNSIYTYTVVVVSLKAGLETDAWSWPIHLSIWGSIVVWFVFVAIYSETWAWFNPMYVEFPRLPCWRYHRANTSKCSESVRQRRRPTSLIKAHCYIRPGYFGLA